MSNANNEFKTDLRGACDLFKEKATRTGDAAQVAREVTMQVYKERGVTEEMVRAVNNANALIANAGNLAGGELANEHFMQNPSADGRFSFTVQGVGRDLFEMAVVAQKIVTIPANESKGTEAREEVRPLQIASQRWTHHSDRGNAEYQHIKRSLIDLGQPLLAAIAKNQSC